MHTLSVMILGIIQGIAEFLPISSSAHLIIFRDLFGIGNFMSSNMALAFDIALHLGTLLAILVFFFSTFVKMIEKGFTKGIKDPDGKILWYLVAATIPAGIVGVFFEDMIENVVRKSYLLIAAALIVMGVLIYLVDKNSQSKKEMKDITLKDVILIGCSQVFALIPGFSRSGTTIAASRALGIKRDDAAKFSFYLSAPVVAGAVGIKLLKKSTWTLISTHLGVFLIGILTSFIVGILCIRFLLKYLDKHDFKAFMVYRILLAIVVAVVVFMK